MKHISSSVSQSIAQASSQEEFLFSALHLLEFDFTMPLINTSSRQLTMPAFEKDNANALFQIIFFLISKLFEEGRSGGAEEPELQQLRLYYPPRNSSDQIEFKRQCMECMAKLEKLKRIPKNFVPGKSVLDVYRGEKIVNFLRQLSEFALRWRFVQEFPQAHLKSFNLRSVAQLANRAEAQLFDLTELYAISSGDRCLLVEESDLLEANTNVYSHLKMEQEKTIKQVQNIQMFDAFCKAKAQEFAHLYHSERKRSLELAQQYTKTRQEVARGLLTELRGLDRIPQLDLTKQTFQELAEIAATIEQNDLLYSLEAYNDDLQAESEIGLLTRDMLLAKSPQDVQDEGQLIHLSQMYQGFCQQLEKSDKCVEKEKLDETIELQDTILNKLRQTKQKLKENQNDLDHLQHKIRKVLQQQ